MHQAPTADQRQGFRPDVEGLRGIAVLMVVLFHGALLGLPGGFIGVDVFFVISGFLITGLLVREHDRSGSIRLRAFYARRIRRLLPAGLVVLGFTLAASLAIFAPLDRPAVAFDAAATALSVGNIRFALAEGDYFATVASPSPFLHFWSLAVEEQFYLVWPAVVLLAARGPRPWLGVGATLGLVFVTSLIASVMVTGIAANWAFYSLPTRAWQLALGGLVAVAAPALVRIPAAISAAAAWLGLGALLATALLLDGSMPYPGVAALVPTIAAALLINAGMTARGPGALLSCSPLRFLGRISYSLYLWHWPLLVLPAVALEVEPAFAIRVMLIGLAVAAAWVSWRFIEEPFRAGFPTLSRYPGRTVLAGATAVALTVVITSSLALAAERGLDGPVAADATAGPTFALQPTPFTVEPTPTIPPSAATGSPSPSAVPPSAPTPTPTAAPVTYVRLPRDIRPSLKVARSDEERLRGDGCLAFESAVKPRDCVYGDASAAFTVALVGDSHAAQWFPALEQVAAARHWRILTFVKVACPFVDIRIRNVALKREYTECAAYRAATIVRLRHEQPDLVLVSNSRFAIRPVRDGDTNPAARAAGLARMLEQLPGLVVVVVDTPEAGRDVPSCLSKHVADVRACAISTAVASSGRLGQIERDASAITGALLVDLTPRICRGDPCPVAVDGMIVFRDSRHLTATFSASLAVDLDRALQPLFADPVGSPAGTSAPAPMPQDRFR